MDSKSENLKECMICGSKDPLDLSQTIMVQEHWHKTGSEYFQYGFCTGCHTYMLNDPHVINNLSKYYPQDYYSTNTLYIPPTEKEIATTKSYYSGKLHIEFTDPVLDFGGGKSQWAYSMVKAGYKDVTVLDPFLSKEAIKEMEEEGIKVIKDFIWDLDIKKYANTYGFIYSSHSLEHVQDPLGTLNSFHSLLKHQGKVELHIPIYGASSLKYGPQLTPVLDAPRHIWATSHKGMFILVFRTPFAILGHSFEANAFNRWAAELAGKGMNPADYNGRPLDLMKHISESEMRVFEEQEKESQLCGMSDAESYILIKLREVQ